MFSIDAMRKCGLAMVVMAAAGAKSSAFADDKAASKPVEATKITFVVTAHVMLFDGRIVTWEEIEAIALKAAEAGKIHPQFYSTNGGLAREDELRERQFKLYAKLYEAGKADGFSVGSLSPRAGERLDRIRTREDLYPNMDARLRGAVVDGDGKPLENVEVFLLPAEHINGVYLKDGRNRNSIEEHLILSDVEGRFLLYPEDDEAYVVAAHEKGFATATLDEFRHAKVIKLQPWASVFGSRPAEGPDAEQGVNFVCYPIGPGLSFHIYETEIAADGSYEQKFAPPGRITVSRSIALGDGGSRSTPVAEFALGPGESREVKLGPIPKD